MLSWLDESLRRATFSMAEDAKFLKRKIRGGSVDVHPTEKALIVNYETEATILGEMGNPMIGDRKEGQKIIRVRNLNENTDIPELARKIVDNCKLICDSKIPQIEHLLRYLLKRKETNNVKAKSSSVSEKLAQPGSFESTETDEIAHLNDLDDYLELLYEDIPDKLRASALVLQLARNPDNLEELFQNETLVGALARVLREDWKKSTDLATNIVYVFFCFSSFSNFHSVILHFKIGALTMSVIEHEIQKYDLWVEELERKRRLASAGSNKTDSANMDKDENSASGDAQKNYETSLAKFDSLVHKQEQLFRVSFYLLLNISEDLSVEVKMHNKGIVTLICQCLNRDNFELLILLISFLKKLSIFTENKDEMLKNRIIDKLNKLLSRPEEDLVNTTLRLLFNLSFDTKARLEMINKGLLQKLVGLLDKEQHHPVVLYILYHLSTEDQSKTGFAQTNCLSYLLKTILECPTDKTDNLPMALAINLACDPTCASMMAEGRAMKMLIKRALKFRDTMIMKLLRNMTLIKDELKLKLVDYLPELVEIVTTDKIQSGQTSSKTNGRKTHSNTRLTFKNRVPDDLRGLSSEPDNGDADFDNGNISLAYNSSSLKFHDDFVNADGEDVDEHDQSDFQIKDEDFVLECLGCLANLNLKDIDFTKVLNEFKLLEWIKHKFEIAESISFPNSTRQLNPVTSVGMQSSITSRPCYLEHTQDDILLEIIRLLGSICQDSQAAEMVSSAGIIENLIGLLKAKQEDDEIVCQIAHVFYHLVFHESTRQIVVKSTQVPAYLVDLMHDKNAEIRRICDISLDIISEFDSTWGARIQAERFRWHNSQWLEMIESAQSHAALDPDPTAEAVLAAALNANHHIRSRHHSGFVTEDHPNDFELGEPDDTGGPFGMGVGIDDAAAFLMSLPKGAMNRKGSAGSDRQMGLDFEEADYLNQLEMLYPEMYGDTNFMVSDRLSPALTSASQYDSDSDITPRDNSGLKIPSKFGNTSFFDPDSSDINWRRMANARNLLK